MTRREGQGRERKSATVLVVVSPAQATELGEEGSKSATARQQPDPISLRHCVFCPLAPAYKAAAAILGERPKLALADSRLTIVRFPWSPSASALVNHKHTRFPTKKHPEPDPPASFVAWRWLSLK